jgi:bifunctional DNA-binding transcriptional regulator/antitoxin component of YhaV-PrlF toxin-antitoxin module
VLITIEKIVTTAKAYMADSSKVVVIPKTLRKQLGEENTDLFIVKIDDNKRIILEPIKKVIASDSQ